MDKFQIETAQNVTIHQNIAGVGDRIIAALIDSVLIMAYFFITLFIVSQFGINSAKPGELMAFYAVIALPAFLYNLLFETFMDGRTPGKMAMKLKVVKLDGSKPGFGSFFGRWLLGFIDISFSSGGIAIITILLSTKGQRLGDMAAGTTVISEKKHTSLRDTLIEDIPEDYIPTYPQVTVFTDKDMQTIKTLFSGAKMNNNFKTILMLSDRIKQVAQITTDEKPLHFVARAISDYNYYTQQ